MRYMTPPHSLRCVERKSYKEHARLVRAFFSLRMVELLPAFHIPGTYRDGLVATHAIVELLVAPNTCVHIPRLCGDQQMEM